MAKTIFLSHIHEERQLALVVKKYVEDEFSGFVDVFVSSDGTTIPAGANFLRRIENGLISCVGAIYLISPVSVKRNWINFELGAVWIRSSIEVAAGRPEIPVMPFCHSGSEPSTLPQPLNNLNAISISQSSQLETAFRSIQSAVGGRGNLKTDFDKLSAETLSFIKSYTVGSKLKEVLDIMSLGQANLIVDHCKNSIEFPTIPIKNGVVKNSDVERLKVLEKDDLLGLIKVEVIAQVMGFGSAGPMNGCDVVVHLSPKLILEHKYTILKQR